MSDELICECGHLISLHIDKADDDGCKHTNESGDSYDCSCFLRPVDIQLAASEAESKDLKSLTNDALTWEYWRDRARDTEKALAEAKGLLKDVQWAGTTGPRLNGKCPKCGAVFSEYSKNKKHHEYCRLAAMIAESKL